MMIEMLRNQPVPLQTVSMVSLEKRDGMSMITCRKESVREYFRVNDGEDLP